MAYTFEQIFAADPSNQGMFVSRGVITIFAPGDTTQTPIKLTTVDGRALANPITVNEAGYGPAFMADLDRVAWAGGGYTGFLTSYDGMKEDTVAARDAAVDARVAAEEAARNSSAPTQEAVAQALGTEGPARAAVDQAIAEGTAAFALKPDNGGKPVGKGELMVNVMDYGAKGDGIADDTAAIQAAADAAFALSVDAELFMPARRFKTTSELVILCGMRASAASIYYYGAGTAMTLGRVGMSMTRKTISLPRVHNWTNGYNPTRTDGSSVGVKAINLISCDLFVPFIQFFDTNLYLHGAGAGFGYNTVYLQSLWGGRRGLVITNDGAAGWANQNLILGGRISVLTQPDRYEDSTFIEVNGNSNTFMGTSLEGGDVTRYRAIISSRYNRFLNCRWERTGNVGAQPRVLYRTDARSNVIDGGYNTVNLEEVWESPLDPASTGGRIDDDSPIAATAKSVSKTDIPNGVETAISSWNQINGRRFSYDPATGDFTLRPGRWHIQATVSFDANTAGYREVKLLNGAVVEDIARVEGGTVIKTIKVSATVSVVPGRKIKVAVFQNSGASLGLVTSGAYCRFEAEYLRVEG